MPNQPAPQHGGAQAGGAQAKKAAPPPRSFLVGTQKIYEGGDYDNTVTLASTAVTMPIWQIQPTGFLAGIWLWALALAAGNSAAVAFAQDAPFNAVSSFQIADVNNKPLIGPFSMYDLHLVNKYGGYGNADDPRASSIYNVTAGAGATGGSFQFGLYVPLEIVARDPLGPVPSESNTASLSITFVTNALANIYTTAPTAAPTLRIRAVQRAYWPPKTADKYGAIQPAPPVIGTTQFWIEQSPAISSGLIQQQCNVGLGYPFRTYIFKLLDSTNSRANGEANWPDPLTALNFEGNQLMKSYYKTLWQRQMGCDYGHNGATFDSANAKENGVYVINFNQEFAFGRPGSETRRCYLLTAEGGRYEFQGSVGGAGTLVTLCNYVSPAGKNAAALTYGR